MFLLSLLPTIRVIDVVDILLVAFLVYQLFRLVKGTNVISIFWALVIIYITWQVVSALHMRLSSEILGQFINIGLIALLVIFQPEIRKFLLLVGTKTKIGGNDMSKYFRFWRHNITHGKSTNYEPYIQACRKMSETKTGALIIFQRQNEVEEIINTGERIDAKVSAALLETLFFKNSPLHDGAVIVHGECVIAARCILPVTARTDIDPNLGLRHRSAIGISEQLDVISVIVSEETGAISYVVDGEIHHNVTAAELRQFLEQNIK